MPSMAEETLYSRIITQAEEEEEEERDATTTSRDWLQLGLAKAGPLSVHVVAGRRASAWDPELFGERPSSSSSSSSAVLATSSRRLISRRPWESSWNCTEMVRETSSRSATTTTPRRSWEEAAGDSSSRRNSSSMMRVVISPPRRRSSQTGVWFTLQAAQNRGRDRSLLPQIIPRNYLRTSEAGMLTVRWVMKYLVAKLGLEDESQVEITCRDHLLPPFWTLQYVREHIWCSGDPPPIHPNSPTTIHHVMTLQYYRPSMSS